MAWINVQVKLPPELVQKIDPLRGPENGWARAEIVRMLIEEALAHRFSLPKRSVERPNAACADQAN